MDLFTYLMAKNGNNTSVHGDLFSYLLGKGQSQTQTISGTTIYIPNAKKLVSFMMTKESTQDGTPTPENPVEVKTVKGSVDVKVVGKNLFDKNTATYINGKILDDNGNQINSTQSGYLSSYVNVNPNTEYTIQGKLNSIDNTYRLYYYDINKNWISRTSTLSFNTLPYTFTTPNNCYYMQFQYISNIYDANTIQIEEGTTATTYEAYQETITTIPLNNNEIVGIGDYKDELKVDKSGHVFINKKCGKMTFNGSENWVLSTNLTDVTRFQLVVPGVNELISQLSSHFRYLNSFSSNSEHFYIYNNRLYVFINNSIAMTAEQFKTWLSTHNTEVYYVLAQENLIDLQTTVDLSLFKGVNNITNSEDGYMTIEYK